MRLIEYSVFFSLCSSVLLGVWVGGCLVGCGLGTPDPRELRGALSAAAQALEAKDARQLFRLIDKRGRNALASIAKSHARACALIAADYPDNERQAALAAVGDCAAARSPEELFAARCGDACMAELAALVGAPVSEKAVGDEVEVRTARGTLLHMHPGTDGWYGIVWKTPELIAERTEASRQLQAISDNAAIYRKRRNLEATAQQAAPPPPTPAP